MKVDVISVTQTRYCSKKRIISSPKNASPILGIEVAGTIIDLGENTVNWNIGDEVCTLVNGGGYAEYCLSHQRQTLRFSQGFDAIKLSLPESFFTAWANLFQVAKLCSGQTVLIHRESSGVGIAAIQLAVSSEATVYTTARSEEKCLSCVKLGAKYQICNQLFERKFFKILKKKPRERGLMLY
ncbi:alcohol dehydrogenase catalytic domain-containing protein [Candidatus Liberibacter solanacearum]|uniref:alcohol dehydrogenase catalytic domain-containing protein n=1 Tax=Candidatus Liberibacter solanacearum TaxID=556287 RepID=UPI00387DBF9B